MGYFMYESNREIKGLWRTLLLIAGETAGYLRDLREQKENLWSVVKRQELYRDVARKIDIIAEEYVTDLIKFNQLDSLIVSEESGTIRLSESPQYVIALDPLDGSVNYLLGMPWCSVSLALAKLDKENKMACLGDVIVGVIASIVDGKLYSFIHGIGCFIGFQKAKVLNPQVKLILGYSNVPEWHYIVDSLRKMQRERLAVRQFGCASLEIIYVGLGIAKVFIDLRAKLRNVDVAAALGFVRELKVPYHSLHTNVDEVPLTRLEKIPSLIVAENEDTLKIVEKLYSNAHRSFKTS